MKSGQKLVYAAFVSLLVASFVVSHPIRAAATESFASAQQERLQTPDAMRMSPIEQSFDGNSFDGNSIDADAYVPLWVQVARFASRQSLC